MKTGRKVEREKTREGRTEGEERKTRKGKKVRKMKRGKRGERVKKRNGGAREAVSKERVINGARERMSKRGSGEGM